MPRKLTQEEVIQKFIETHGHKYDYSKVKYIGSMIKVCIICPTHGEFPQTPSGHIRGYGCDKCIKAQQSIDRKITWSVVYQQFYDIHGDNYHYYSETYNDNGGNMKMSCNICGEIFWQTPKNHKIGQGCTICAAKRRSLTLDDIKIRSMEIYGDKYDFTDSVFDGVLTSMMIKCKECGEYFDKIVTYFIHDECGCTNCGVGFTDPLYIHYIYQITNTLNGMIYIGKHSTKKQNDRYMGSGTALNEAQKEFGRENFERIIIEYCESRSILNQKEREIVNDDFVKRVDTYNLICGY